VPGEGSIPELYMPISRGTVISMTDNPGGAVDTMREKLQGGEYDISDAGRELLLTLDDRIQLLGPSEFSTHRHEFLLRRGLIIAKRVGGLNAALEDRDAAETIVKWINREQTGSPETNKDYRVALRTIATIVTDGEDPPESVAWVPGGYPEDYDPAPDPTNMLWWEADIQPMLNACLNSRDRALVALAWDLGPRPGELFDLIPGTITDHDYGLQVTLQGKTGQRSPVLVPSVHYVRRWLSDHPGDSDDPLWSGLNSPEAISNNRIRDALKDVADRAGVEKPVTPTNFRKSSASYLASQNVSQAHLEDHHGWTRGSRIAARYIAVFDDATEREIAKAHGLDVADDEPDDTGPVVCPRCEQKTPRDEEACVWCDHVLSQEAAEDIEAFDEGLAESIARASDLEDVDADDVLEVYRQVNDNPVLKRLFAVDD